VVVSFQDFIGQITGLRVPERIEGHRARRSCHITVRATAVTQPTVAGTGDQKTSDVGESYLPNFLKADIFWLRLVLMAIIPKTASSMLRTTLLGEIHLGRKALVWRPTETVMASSISPIFILGELTSVKRLEQICPST
jgi:hypothetical protein